MKHVEVLGAGAECDGRSSAESYQRTHRPQFSFVYVPGARSNSWTAQRPHSLAQEFCRHCDTAFHLATLAEWLLSQASRQADAAFASGCVQFE